MGAALQPLKAALSSNNLAGNTDFYALTANYRLEVPGHSVGTYLIGGGDWYFQNTWLSLEVPAAPATFAHRSGVGLDTHVHREPWIPTSLR